MNRNILIYLHDLNISNNTLLYLVDKYQDLNIIFELSNNTDFLQSIHYSQRDKINKINKSDFKKRISKISDYQNFNIITIYDIEYPRILKTITDKPAVLYIKGNYNFNEHLNIAMVGTRIPSHYGIEITKIISKSICDMNINIISGMAKGIDRISHCVSIINKRPTIAVLGSGIDYVYPKENLDIYNKIPNSGGVIISEYPLGTKPYNYNFPRRNRIISGMSIATVVVEAKQKSGSIITASQASMQGRDVFAVPGRITDETSSGTNYLLKDGAYPIIDIEEFKLNINKIKKIYSEYEIL